MQCFLSTRNNLFLCLIYDDVMSLCFQRSSNVFYRYFDQYDYFDHSQILIFIFSSRRRHRRRHQYEIIQKNFYETSLSVAKIYSFVISLQNNQSCSIFASSLSQFTFTFIRSFSLSFGFFNQSFSSFRFEIDDSEDEIRENWLFNEIRNLIEWKMLIDSRSFE